MSSRAQFVNCIRAIHEIMIIIFFIIVVHGRIQRGDSGIQIPSPVKSQVDICFLRNTDMDLTREAIRPFVWPTLMTRRKKNVARPPGGYSHFFLVRRLEHSIYCLPKNIWNIRHTQKIFETLATQNSIPILFIDLKKTP